MSTYRSPLAADRVRLSIQSVERGDFPRLHCDDCDFPWWMHQDDAPFIMRLLHEFEIPEDVPEEES